MDRDKSEVHSKIIKVNKWRKIEPIIKIRTQTFDQGGRSFCFNFGVLNYNFIVTFIIVLILFLVTLARTHWLIWSRSRRKKKKS